MKKKLIHILSAASVLLICFSNMVIAQGNPGSLCPSFTVIGQAVSCNVENENNGQIGGTVGNGSVQVTGLSNAGTTPTINWTSTTPFSGSSNALQLTNLNAGTYTVSIRNEQSGCTTTGSYVVTAPDPLSIYNVVIKDVKCYGENTGSISLSVDGGSGTRTYSWKKNNVVVATTKNLSNVGAGVYELTVTDVNGCWIKQTFTVNQPLEAIAHSQIINDAKCYGTATGSIDLTVWGGTPPYSYAWNNGTLNQDISNVNAGNYSVQVKDYNNCVLEKSFVIGQPTQLTGSIAATDVLCKGDYNGTLTATIFGGTTPYNYSWQNTSTLYAQNSPTLTNLPADQYKLTLTDKNNCSLVLNKTINEPSELMVSHTYGNISCYGGNDGFIHLIASGGTPGYTYDWSNGIGQNLSHDNAQFNNLVADVYTVNVIDMNGCTKTVVQELTQPPLPISVEVSVVDVKCYGDNTGSISLDVLGGTPPYAYTWTSGQTTGTIDELFSDNYGYTVIDSKGCSFPGSQYVAQPAAPLTVTNVLTHVNCFGESNGVVDLTVTGGTSPYEFYWTNSQYVLSSVTEDLVNFPAESYTYLVTDANNCTETATLTVTEPPLLESTITGVNILCKGGNNGSIDLTVIGGVTPYSYSWNNNAVTQDQEDLYAGTYDVVVLDAHNCLITNGITLTEPQDSLSYEHKIFDVKCNDGQDGRIIIEVAGGTVPYSYLWSNGDTESDISNLVSANYVFVVTDHNGCLLSDTLFVNQPEPLILHEVITDVTCFGLSDGIIDIAPTGGTQPYKFTWFNSSYILSTQEEDLVNWPHDVYQLEVIDSNDCFYERFLTIPQPEKLEITYSSTRVSCFDGSDGSIYVDVTGGNPGYTYNWSNGSIIEDQVNIPAGIYNLMVTDTKNCKDSIEVDIIQPDQIKLNFDFTNVTCIDQHDGTATALPYGGNGGYLYDWSTGEFSSSIAGLSNQYYSVTVVDVLGCYGSDSVYIPKDSIGCIIPVTAFTPNGDNYNDKWVIDNMYLYPDLHLQVMNRWGNLVYEQVGAYEPWDGKSNGDDLPADVYYYMINLNYPDRKPLIGNITIVR